MTRRIYIAGPMTGLPDNNYPAFHAEAARLRGLGFTVENPAENSAPACGSWQGYMRLALNQLITCHAVALLPGWTDSRGALLERYVAFQLGMPTLEAAAITSPALPLVAQELRP
ncbi:DUF4406 domain-containing protein [Pseudomonas aeruginosa]|nr:DUF4406 domain-containing protein [Pseudomonas aeruginosa]MBG4718222.1 DUF4406 domain-containing protein [Pseudomonas aeruginosa]